MQASIQAQNSMLIQLCASIDRLAASSTEATQATTSLAEHSSATAAAAVTAATQAQLQQAQASAKSTLPGSLARAAAECVVGNAGYAASLVLKGVAKAAAEADVVAAVLCHKVLLSEYVPAAAAARGGASGGRRSEFLTLRCVSLLAVPLAGRLLLHHSVTCTGVRAVFCVDLSFHLLRAGNVFLV